MKSNIIPPIIHELGKSWDQPDPSLIQIDDNYAKMPKKVFDALAEYSASNPTGVYEGKMWKRNDGAFDREFLAKGGQPTWYLCWYGLSEKGPDFCSNHRRKIIIV